jgi:hypothetical protein
MPYLLNGHRVADLQKLSHKSIFMHTAGLTPVTHMATARAAIVLAVFLTRAVHYALVPG